MRREKGATMVEYILMVSLIAIALVAAIKLFQAGVTEHLDDSVDCMQSFQEGAGDCPGVPQSN